MSSKAGVVSTTITIISGAYTGTLRTDGRWILMSPSQCVAIFVHALCWYDSWPTACLVWNWTLQQFRYKAEIQKIGLIRKTGMIQHSDQSLSHTYSGVRLLFLLSLQQPALLAWTGPSRPQLHSRKKHQPPQRLLTEKSFQRKCWGEILLHTIWGRSCMARAVKLTYTPDSDIAPWLRLGGKSIQE